MNITVIGSGYVGLVTGTCLAELGNNVFCLDLDSRKIELLQRGCSPIYEKGIEDMIRRNLKAGRLHFSTDIGAGVSHGDIQFIAVGTPPSKDGSADLQYVISAAREIGRRMTGFKVIINKSTVPVGTAKLVSDAIEAELILRSESIDYAVVSNPEFLREGLAVDDFMNPDRIVIGVEDTEKGLVAKKILDKLYSPFKKEHQSILYMDLASAELTKYAANAMLATRISFMNEISNLADCLGADIEKVRLGIGSDSRIGPHFLYAGIGYGGSCFPKDVRALIQTAKIHRRDVKILQAVHDVNQEQKKILINKLADYFDRSMKDLTIAMWGLAFKPNTDDLRDAPSIDIIHELLNMGAKVKVYDPVLSKDSKCLFSANIFDLEFVESGALVFETSMTSAVEAADALLIVTEWAEFRGVNLEELRNRLKRPIIFDGRNLYDPLYMHSIGFDYFSIGRPKLSV